MLFYFLLNICASISKYSGTITVPCPSIEHCLACYSNNEARSCWTCEKDYYPVLIWEGGIFGKPEDVIICNKSNDPEISISTPIPTYPPIPTYHPHPTYPPIPTLQKYPPIPTYHPQPTYHPLPTYHPHQTYHPLPTYQPHPTYAPIPTYPAMETKENEKKISHTDILIYVILALYVVLIIIQIIILIKYKAQYRKVEGLENEIFQHDPEPINTPRPPSTSSAPGIVNTYSSEINSDPFSVNLDEFE